MSTPDPTSTRDFHHDPHNTSRRMVAGPAGTGRSGQLRATYGAAAGYVVIDATTNDQAAQAERAGDAVRSVHAQMLARLLPGVAQMTWEGAPA